MGDVWRIISGNLTHAGTGHWAVNMAGLWVLWFIYIPLAKSQYKLISVLLISALGTCLGLLFFEPDLRWYVGLSGALHGLFAASILFAYRYEPRLQIFLFIMLSAKLCYEQIAGPIPGSETISGVMVIVNSHLYGAISGLIAGILFITYQKRKLLHLKKFANGDR